MDNKSCAYCGTGFVKQGKSYCRRSIGSSLKTQKLNKTIKDVLKEEFDIRVEKSDEKERFLCNECAKLLANFHKVNKASKELNRQMSEYWDPTGYIAMKIKRKQEKKARGSPLKISMSGTGASVSPLTTHVLDTARGLPAGSVSMVLHQRNQSGVWEQLETVTTNADGRGAFLKDRNWTPGVYKLYFDTESYFASQKVKGFYPYVEVVFQIDDPEQHYHVPLLLSPYGYSTYRGS